MMQCRSRMYETAREARYDYFRKLDKFRAKSSTINSFGGGPGLSVNICSDREPCPALFILYAKMGIHRYNLLNGTNLELLRVLKYNYLVPILVSHYYITSLVIDRATSKELEFQTQVDEHLHGELILSCYLAKTLAQPEPTVKRIFFKNQVPKWPSENPFHQYKLLKESEVQQNDWIRLYLELAIAIRHRGLSKDHDLSNVTIFKVAIDNMGEGLNAKKATVYIHYKDPCEARVGKNVDRVALVRRNYDEETGRFSLEGRNQRSKGINIMMPEKKGKDRTAKLNLLLVTNKLWRHKAYRKRRLHKTSSICQR